MTGIKTARPDLHSGIRHEAVTIAAGDLTCAGLDAGGDAGPQCCEADRHRLVTAPHWRGAILLAEPVPADDTSRHLGRHILGGRQLDLTRHIIRPDVCHICVSADATAMVCDTIGYGGTGIESYLYTATLDNDVDGPFVQPRYLLHPKSSWKPYWCETLPCMTPDKKWIFFNSDYPGVNGYKGARHTPQIFAIRGMAWKS